jgi:hypothetical protein
MSSQVQALLNDVKARRESTIPSIGTSPFPDFDRTLQNLAEVDGKFGSFSFNLDPNLAEAEMEDDTTEFPEATSPFHGSFMDAFLHYDHRHTLRDLVFHIPNDLSMIHMAHPYLARPLPHILILAHLTRLQRAMSPTLQQL